MIEFVIGAALFFLVAASYYDLRTGEIPDRISLGMAGFFLFIALVSSVFSHNPSFIVNSAVIGASYFIAAYLLLRLGQWGGGDVKLFAGIGCLLGYMNAAGLFGALAHKGIIPYYLVYPVNMGFAAIPYAAVYALVLGFITPGVFSRFAKEAVKPQYLVLLAASTALSVFFFARFGQCLFLVIPAYIVLSIYLKAVEKVALQKTINVDALSIGDVPAQDIKTDGELIAKKNDIEGLESGQIEQIRKLAADGKIPQEIQIKWGIKFAPIFLLAFVAMILVGNVLEVMVVP
ncbi:MAG: hypothetical protein MSIBF_01160 [Candidatus Altiarchaeales archaeon IMC4]|nr:MAG: hypothetical protein MSIBF_01160 [Candidatus Altiarchaeales archaeon IMC4]